jgi:vacuolar-type H+-ATPase subunit E/Vma4
MELLEKIRREGEEKVAAILREAEEEAQRRLEAAERALEQWREEALKRAQGEAESEKRLILSRARAQAREIVLRAKSEAGERLFQELVAEAERLREDPERYKAFLKRCLEEAEQEIQGPLVLQVDPRDEAIFEELLQGTPHKIQGHIRTLGGFIATNERGDLLIDDRIETRIQKLRELHRAELSRALFAQAAPMPQQ